MIPEINVDNIKDRNFDESTDIIIYTMGKVGSKTIRSTLIYADISFFDVHSLRLIEALRAGESIDDVNPNQVQESLYLSKLKEDKGMDRRWKVITLVREPISRIISDRFHHVETLFPHLKGRSDDAAIEEITAFLTDILTKTDIHLEQSHTWFDNEIKTLFGYDVYKEDFDKASGYSIYRAKNADILVMKLEKLSDCFQDAFRDFLGLEKVQLLISQNVAQQKPYNKLYEGVLRSIQLHDDLVDELYHGRYTRHFYSDPEIAAFNDKWTGRKQKEKDAIIRQAEILITTDVSTEKWQELDKAIALHTEACDIYNMIAELYLNKADLAKALNFFSKTLQKDTYNRTAVIGAAMILTNVGRKESASNIYMAYLSRNHYDSQVKELLTQVQTGNK